MAKDLYESRKMYQSPVMLYILMPIGMIALFFILDYGLKVYNEHKVKKDTYAVMQLVMEQSDNTDLNEYAVEKLNELGYEDAKVTLIEKEDGIYLFCYKQYFTMFGELKGGKKSLATARYKGYRDANKEVVIEEYDPDALEETDDSSIIPVS